MIVYLWEGYQFRKWKVYDRLLIGRPKPLHLVNNYGQLSFYMSNGGPSPTYDRGVRVDVEWTWSGRGVDVEKITVASHAAKQASA